MLSDDLTRMAREAGLHLPYWDDDQDPQSNPPAGWAMVSPIGPPLERFARAVERAAYAKAKELCSSPYSGETDDPYEQGFNRAVEVFADAIHALGRQ